MCFYQQQQKAPVYHFPPPNKRVCLRAWIQSTRIQSNPPKNLNSGYIGNRFLILDRSGLTLLNEVTINEAWRHHKYTICLLINMRVGGGAFLETKAFWNLTVGEKTIRILFRVDKVRQKDTWQGDKILDKKYRETGVRKMNLTRKRWWRQEDKPKMSLVAWMMPREVRPHTIKWSFWYTLVPSWAFVSLEVSFHYFLLWYFLSLSLWKQIYSGRITLKK